MAIDNLRIYQYAFVSDKGDTCVLSIIENPNTGDTLRKMHRYPAYPLYQCALDSWNAVRDALIAIAEPRTIRVNSNVLGVFRLDKTKKGYKTEVLRDRHFDDSELSRAWITYSCDDGDGDVAADEPDEPEQAQ